MTRNQSSLANAHGFLPIGAQAVDPSGGDVTFPDTRLPMQFYCTGAGDVALTGVDGTDVVIPMVENSIMWFALAAIKQTGTTATGIIVLF